MDKRRSPAQGQRRFQGITHAVTPTCGRLRARLRLSCAIQLNGEHARRASELSQRAFQTWADQLRPNAVPNTVQLQILIKASIVAIADFDRIVVCVAPGPAAPTADPRPPIPVLPLASGGYHAERIAAAARQVDPQRDMLRVRTCLRTAVADVILTMYRHVPPSVDRLSLITGACPLVANAITRIAAGWIGDVLCRSLLEHGLKRERTLRATSDLLCAALPNVLESGTIRLSPIPIGSAHVALAVADVLEQSEPSKSLVADLDCTFSAVQAQIQMVAAAHCAQDRIQTC